jgi:hypothetical protein
MLIHLVYLVLGGSLGFFIACLFLGTTVDEYRRHLEYATNTIRRLSDENLALAQRFMHAPKPPRRIYRSRSNLLTDDESDALWESVMGEPDA